MKTLRNCREDALTDIILGEYVRFSIDLKKLLEDNPDSISRVLTCAKPIYYSYPSSATEYYKLEGDRYKITKYEGRLEVYA